MASWTPTNAFRTAGESAPKGSHAFRNPFERVFTPRVTARRAGLAIQDPYEGIQDPYEGIQDP